MGSFIAALRKSKGMTQQEVADHLNVSNKTVSKWERDDGYPEITVIPAIAELFSVTADEILRGQRIPKAEISQGKSTVKVDRQIRFLLNQAVTRFKNTTYISMALIFVGLNSMFTISYALYRCAIGFGVMLALVTAGSITQLIAINGFLSVVGAKGLLAEKEEDYKRCKSILYRYSFSAFALAALTIILSLPLVVYRDLYYVNSVLRLGDYLKLLPWLLLAAGMLCVGGHAFVSRLVFPEKKSPQRRARLKPLNKRFIIIFAIVLTLTALGQIAINYWISLPEKQEFASLEELEEFTAQADQYQRSKEAAKRNGWLIVTEGENPWQRIVNEDENKGQRRVFLTQDQFENIARVDWDNLKVYWHETTFTVEKKVTTLGFGLVYLLEVIVLGAIYLYRRSKIA